ncbi:methylmalonyl-CoA epimerase [Paracoccus litorisediminis]|uniref:Methylmalonyl-CoA epimerase n=1 Tax=Paracoccus litorisediminis TaxID=2006130 RepID=A0A844HRN8_9RHOB|nr:methylmalonyl-CoA epimerase [Paracoccus litorisediminis]MTH60311.1 methylmalonyl-CoA epimerase [Paracoccus litorisediminis]
MIKRVNHIAIAVPDLELAAQTWRNLGVTVSEPQTLPEHGVRVVFLEFGNVKLELLEAYGEGSPIGKFMQKNPSGGMHHVCFDVDDIGATSAKLQDAGIRVLGGGQPKIGAHGNPVLFAHPSDLFGVLTEFEEPHSPES